MKEYIVDRDRRVAIYELHEALVAAGSSDHDHVFDRLDCAPRRCGDLVASPVVIEDGAWLGQGSVVLKGVRIGRRSVVGANAVVTRNVPPGCVVCGVPASVVRQIDFKDFTKN